MNSEVDTDRTLRLLWRRTLGEVQGSRGPRQRASVDDVVRVGIELADADGDLAGLSMRKVAEGLGLGAMSVYTYVSGKEELVALMVDEVYGEAAMPALVGDLRADVTAVAGQLWDEFHRHPWLLQVGKSRPWIGPHASARYEWQLRALDGVGLTDLEMDQALAMVAGFSEACARDSVEARRTREASGISDLEWWERNAPVLESLMDGADYPVSSRVGQAAGEAYQSSADPARAFDFGLARILDGLEAHLRTPRP